MYKPLQVHDKPFAVAARRSERRIRAFRRLLRRSTDLTGGPMGIRTGVVGLVKQTLVSNKTLRINLLRAPSLPDGVYMDWERQLCETLQGKK